MVEMRLGGSGGVLHTSCRDAEAERQYLMRQADMRQLPEKTTPGITCLDDFGSNILIEARIVVFVSSRAGENKR